MLNRFSRQAYNTSISTRYACAYQPAIILPTFNPQNEVIPLSNYAIDCSKFDMKNDPENYPDLCGMIKDQFKDLGLVLLTNTGLAKDKKSIEKWSKVPLGNTWKYEGGANERNYLDDDSSLYDVGAPGNMDMHYHHEMTQVRLSTEALAFSMVEGIGLRGGCWLSDSLKVTED